jgi:hypothetical protein
MVLTDDEVASMLSSLPANVDTAEARQQVVEQWVTRSLLLREAERLNLRENPTVQRRMKEQERSILVTALTDRMYTEAELGPSEAEIRNFFQSNRRQMALREPFVRVRHFATRSVSEADSARMALQQAAAAGRSLDSTFSSLIDRYAEFPDRARRLTAEFVPESRLFGHYPYVRDELSELGENEIAPVVEDDSLFHLLQLVERIPEGSEPELAWVEDEIRRRLTIRSRKQMYAREVQRLRNQALARNDLQFGAPSADDNAIDGDHVEGTATADSAEDTTATTGGTGEETGDAREEAASPEEFTDQGGDAVSEQALDESPAAVSSPADTAPAETAPDETNPTETNPTETVPDDGSPAEASNTDTTSSGREESSEPAETTEPEASDTSVPDMTDPDTSPADTASPDTPPSGAPPSDTTPSDTTSQDPRPSGEETNSESPPAVEPPSGETPSEGAPALGTPSEETPSTEEPAPDEEDTPADTSGDGT